VFVLEAYGSCIPSSSITNVAHASYILVSIASRIELTPVVIKQFLGDDKSWICSDEGYRQ